MQIKKRTIDFGRIANIVGKGENAGYQHFLLLAQRVQKASLSQGCYKSGLCGNGLNLKADENAYIILHKIVIKQCY